MHPGGRGAEQSAWSAHCKVFRGTEPDYQILFQFGAISAFRRVRDGNHSRNKMDLQLMLLGVALGRSELTSRMVSSAIPKWAAFAFLQITSWMQRDKTATSFKMFDMMWGSLQNSNLMIQMDQPRLRSATLRASSSNVSLVLPLVVETQTHRDFQHCVCRFILTVEVCFSGPHFTWSQIWRVHPSA